MLVTFLILEIFTRLYLFGWKGFSPENVNSFTNIYRAQILETTPDQRPYHLKANLDVRFKCQKFKTNRWGMRELPIAQKKNPAIYRVAVVGDSYSMGDGVAAEETYHAQAEKQLQQNGARCELLNFGISGYSLIEYREEILRQVVQFEPDEILIGFCAYNDHLQPGVDYTPPLFRPQSQANQFWNSWFWRWVQTFRTKSDLRELRYTEAQKKYITEQLKELKAICKARGIRLSLIYLGITYTPELSVFMQKACASEGIAFRNGTVAFKNLNFHDYILGPLDSHPNPSGHELLGKACYKIILSHYKSWKSSNSNV